ncbi:MAG: IS1182 family transposase [Rhizobacter sp.]|nr:IS1182 family transposase [Rhizobacter sp.]
MNYVAGASREQSLLFPEVIDDYITPENPVRFIDAFVEELALQELGFRHATLPETGRPPYDPGDLLRLYVYGYLNRVRSSRRLEAEAQRNLEVVWLLRKLRPDFKTIADFRKDNGPAIKAVCRQFTLLCRKLELFGGELIAVDGSKFAAQNAKDRNFSQKKLKALLEEIDQRIERYLGALAEADQGEEQAGGGTVPKASELKEKIAALKDRQGRYRELFEGLEQSGESQVSLSDPDSRAMSQGAGVTVGYNVQAAVDAKHSLIVATDVTNTSSDSGELSGMAIKAQEALGVAKLAALADKGYYHGKEILACDSVGITAYVAKPMTSANTAQGLYGKERFTYEPERNVYVCPSGRELTYRFSTNEKGRPIHYYRASDCQSCELRNLCTRNKANRTITRLAFEEIQEAMAVRVQANPELMKRRKAIIEHCFGTIKRTLGYSYFLCRGFAKVKTELSLTVLAYNLKRAINLVGVRAMIEALG